MRSAILSILFLSLLISANISACDETITIDTTEYSVGSRWCGRQIDTTLIPPYEQVGRIPKEFCYNESKIYIEKEARDKFVEMAEAALKDSVQLFVKSGFRSLSYQKHLVKKRLNKGESFSYIMSYVAPPGYSEHHLGVAVDLTAPGEKFKNSKAYAWLLNNGARFNFVERYPKNNKTLKTWEPWHWSYEPPVK